MLALDQILGQSRAIETLTRACRADRLPHGMIFAGPAGVGKATTARALATLFLCPHAKNLRPCRQCDACTLMQAGNHPDYHVITKELIRVHDKTGKSKGIELSIHVIRPELVERAAMKSAMNVGKVFVIEQAELMNPQAQNAMLKTLEEPAGRTLIILLTDQPGSLLQTINSRCQTVRFASLDPQTVARELARRGIPSADAASAAQFAEGSIGLALKWLADGVILHATELYQRLDSILQGRPAGDLPEFLKAIAEEYALKQVERDPLSSKDQANREAIGLYFQLTAQFFRKLLPQTPDPSSLERLCAAIDAVARAETYLDANVTIALIFQQLTVTLESLLSPGPNRQAG